MKKKKVVITLVTLLMICGCSNNHIFKNDEETPIEFETLLVELGYDQESANIADSFSDATKELLLTKYDTDFDTLLKRNVTEETFLDFINSELDINAYLYLMDNNNLDKDTFYELYNDKFFMLENVNPYFKYQEEFSDTRSLIEYVNAKAYQKPFGEAENSDISKDTLMIASKIYFLGNYEPSDLIDVEDGYYCLSKPQLRKVAWDAYKEMADAARNEGLNFYISTAYRSYDFQNTLYTNYLLKDPQEVVDTYSSRPGYSDHQIGLSADIRTIDKAFDLFTSTEEALWLKDNAYKYGFIQRYPEGKQTITGYIPESWHYRYVGKDAAKIIYENNITFDEYYAYYVENK